MQTMTSAVKAEQFLLPNFVIAGMTKAGTSSLHRWLADHPDAFGTEEKETYYFVDPGTHVFLPDRHVSVAGLDGYRTLFPAPAADRPLRFESTPAYATSETALEWLPDLESCPRFLFMLREPSAQIFSSYTYFRNNWAFVPADMDFATFLAAARAGSHEFGGNELAVNVLSNARYADILDRWAARVGRDRMIVRLFEDMVADGPAFTRQLAADLGLDPSFYDHYDFPRENETYQPRSFLIQRVNIAIRNRLPKGAAYERLRDIYRRLNTTRPDKPGENEAGLLAALKAEYRDHNARLAADYDLDLSRWD